MIEPTIAMAGRPAQITFSRLVPGFVGLYQINVVVPAGVGGDVVTTIRAGDAISSEVTINVAGTYALAENYAGIIKYRATGDRFQLELSSFTTLSPTRSGGRYRLLNAGGVIDNGTFEIQSAESLFVASGRSAVVGQPFVGLMDTLDAGRSFFGILYDGDNLDNAGRGRFGRVKSRIQHSDKPTLDLTRVTLASLDATLLSSVYSHHDIPAKLSLSARFSRCRRRGNWSPSYHDGQGCSLPAAWNRTIWPSRFSRVTMIRPVALVRPFLPTCRLHPRPDPHRCRSHRLRPRRRWRCRLLYHQ